MKTNRKVKILLVEDDPNLSMVVQDYLEMLSYDTTLCRDGEEGLMEYRRRKYDLLILDVMMPRMDGFSMAEEIREVDDLTPIIFLTAKSLKEDRIKGFQIGCDDYIAKPFSTEELSLRINAVLRRCMARQTFTAESEDKSFVIGKFNFDSENMILVNGSQKQTLTRKESALLKLLCIYKNKLLSRETALKSIWGDDDYFIGRSMDVFISKLRKYLKEDPNISITNIHGTGFKLEIGSEGDISQD